MKMFLASILLAFSLAANAVEVVGEMHEDQVQKWVDITCAFLEDDYECPEGLPTVGWAVLPQGTWGRYYGQNFMVLSERLAGPQWGTYGQAILAHELAHWIVRSANQEITSCDSEVIAWRVYNAIVLSHGRDDLTVYDWVKNYPDCQGK